MRVVTSRCGASCEDAAVTGAGGARRARRPGGRPAPSAATRRTEDLQRWLACLPAPQALVVHGAALTSDPDAVLGLGLPIASHDGLPTTTQSDTPLTVRRTS